MFAKYRNQRSKWAGWTLVWLSACGGSVAGDPVVYSPLAAAGAFSLDDASSEGASECDWASLTVIAQPTEAEPTVLIDSLAAATTNDALCVAIAGKNISGHAYNLYLDTDGDPINNLKTQHWEDEGSDFVLQQWGGLFPLIGAVWKTGEQAATVLPEPVTEADSRLRLRIPLSALGLGANSRPMAGIGIGIELDPGNVTDFMPRGYAKARIEDSRPKECSVLADLPHKAYEGASTLSGPARAKIPVRHGMIVPAYFEPDSTLWKDLGDAAKIMSAAGKDFWVAVNPNSGPYQDESPEWTAAKSAWENVKTNNGAVFGYVHTCKSVYNEKAHTWDCPGELRGLNDVEKDIATWVKNYPSVDGIWIDEFYPRYEVAATDDAAKPESPNKEVAPRDPNYRKPGLTVAEFQSLKINPECGYYDRLQKWVKAQYPHLVLIGNAGAQLRSNQRRYADRVDVLVSFEQSQYLAENGALEAQREHDATHNAALIHGGTLEALNPMKKGGPQIPMLKRTDLVDRAFVAGYSHVYATDRMYDANPWLGLPVDSAGSSLRVVESAGAGAPTLAPNTTVIDFAGDNGLVKHVASSRR